MQIGEVIKTHRTAKNMTQEEMANRLGVTAPAVNKWENGKTLPDICLLAPIARLLDITLDTLLSFQETLTEKEIHAFVLELDSQLKKDSYEKCFEYGKKLIEQYPNCELLLWQITVLLHSHFILKNISDNEKYENYFCKCYHRILESKDETIRKYAAESLFRYHMKRNEFEKAEEYLNYFSDQNPERKRKQAELYHKSGLIEEAYKTYEELLFSNYQIISMVFHDLCNLAVHENNFETAHYYLDKQEKLANLFEMGKYHEICGKLNLAEIEENKDMIQEIIKQLLECVDSLTAFKNAPLYRHMHFKEENPSYLSDIKKELFDSFNNK